MPFVAVLFTLGLQASKVRTGDWLGEQLTPGLLAIQNLRDVTIDLCLRAVRCDGGCSQHETQTRRRAENVHRRHHAHGLGFLSVAPTLAIGMHRKARFCVTALGKDLPPLANS